MKISIRFYNIREVPSTSSGTVTTTSSGTSSIRKTVVELVETTAEGTAIISK